jgi:hypothetical protein
MKIYVAAFPEAPTMSAAAAKRLKEHQVKKKEEPSALTSDMPVSKTTWSKRLQCMKYSVSMLTY